jgi:hypothetical protein
LLLVAHGIVHEEDEEFCVLLLLEPIPTQVSQGKHHGKNGSSPALRFTKAEVIHLPYPVWEDSVRSNEVFGLDRP